MIQFQFNSETYTNIFIFICNLEDLVIIIVIIKEPQEIEKTRQLNGSFQLAISSRFNFD